LHLWLCANFSKIDFSPDWSHERAFPSIFFPFAGTSMTKSNSPPRPKLTHAPWAGYTAHEHKRDEALALCPSPRCRRLKRCVAASEDLYCRRTHIPHSEYLHGRPQVQEFPTHEDLDVRRERIVARIEERQAVHKAMVVRWRAGEFDHLYGKFKPAGVILQPPPKIYVEKA
jgi:hypothetical protein